MVAEPERVDGEPESRQSDRSDADADDGVEGAEANPKSIIINNGSGGAEEARAVADRGPRPGQPGCSLGPRRP